jgi:hypothetical protein
MQIWCNTNILVKFSQTNLYCIQIAIHNCDYMHVNVALSILLISPKMLTPCGLNLYFYIVFDEECVFVFYKYQ